MEYATTAVGVGDLVACLGTAARGFSMARHCLKGKHRKARSTRKRGTDYGRETREVLEWNEWDPFLRCKCKVDIDLILVFWSVVCWWWEEERGSWASQLLYLYLFRREPEYISPDTARWCTSALNALEQSNLPELIANLFDAPWDAGSRALSSANKHLKPIEAVNLVNPVVRV